MTHLGIISTANFLLRLLALSLLTTFTCAAADKSITFADAKAHYTLQIANNITWPNENDIRSYSIGIVGVNPEIMAAFAERQAVKIKGKAFTFEYIYDVKSLSKSYSIIFITHSMRQLSEQIYSGAVGSLIIADGEVEKDTQMISLISARRRVFISLNQDNLSGRGFDISTNLLVAAGTKEDLTNQLREDDQRLKELLDQVHSKEQSLRKLKDNLEKYAGLLSSAKNKLLEKNSQLDSLLAETEASREDIRENQLSIEEQKLRLKQKQSEILLKENEISNLQKRIEQNQSILQKQDASLKQKSSAIKSKDETIKAQRVYIAAIAIITLIFFSMIYFLLRANNLRKQANEKLEQLNAQLYELATTDGLTKLYNRRHFLETVKKQFIRQQRDGLPSTLLMLDIDHFKLVNDRYGHAMGDEVIKSVASTLEGSLRKYDVVGRMGGEEYAMMLVGCSTGSAFEIANRLCDEIASMDITYNEITINVTISIGLSQPNPEDTKVEQSIHRADQALYQAKEAGRNRVVIFSG